MNRRSFIKFSALTGTSATLASCGNPEYHLIRFIPEDRLVAGIAVWKPSICPLCSAGCGLTVRVMEGDAEVIRDGKLGVTKMGLAKKLEGDPQNPINQGKLCTRGQAAMEVTYHPDRLGHPLKRAGSRGDGKFEEITWDQAMAELTGKLDALAAAGNQKSLAILTRPQRGARGAVLAEFANRFGAAAPLAFEFFGNDVIRRANEMSFGKAQLPTLDLAESQFVISFGADFLGTWNSPVAQNVGYGQMRQGRPGMRGKFVQVEYRMSQSGANADEWVPVKPGTEGVLALGIANAIMKQGTRKASDAGHAGTLVDGWMTGLADHTPQEVEKKTGVTAARIERLAKEFSGQKPAVAIIAGAAVAQTNGLFNALAVNALNALVGSVETAGGIYFTPQPANLGTGTNFAKNGEIGAGAQVLFVDGANPVFASPKAWKVKEAISAVPYIVSFGNFIDETSVMADLILPDHSFLESWVQSAPESGAKTAVSMMAPPVMRPLHDTRATGDVLLEVSKKLAKPLNMPWQKFEDAVKEQPGGNAGRSPLPKPAPAQAAKYAEPQFDGDAGQYGFHFLPYPSIAFLDGSLAHLPLLQELPDPMSSAIWSSWVEINMQTADKMGIRQGDLVEITSSQGSIRVPAFPSPGIAPDVIAMPVGQGHENYTRYASGRGANPIEILAPVKEPETGSLAWAATRVKIAKAADADGRLVLFAGSLRDYPPEGMHR
ncbi:MAG TPA: molybdopterin-dependent oxidoreductase [Terriglobia bacterium]|jgi:anaerobic selenocysteine-containing dehydrogenase